jgi:hypothetical protein
MATQPTKTKNDEEGKASLLAEAHRFVAPYVPIATVGSFGAVQLFGWQGIHRFAPAVTTLTVSIALVSRLGIGKPVLTAVKEALYDGRQIREINDLVSAGGHAAAGFQDPTEYRNALCDERSEDGRPLRDYRRGTFVTVVLSVLAVIVRIFNSNAFRFRRANTAPSIRMWHAATDEFNDLRRSIRNSAHRWLCTFDSLCNFATIGYGLVFITINPLAGFATIMIGVAGQSFVNHIVNTPTGHLAGRAKNELGTVLLAAVVLVAAQHGGPHMPPIGEVLAIGTAVFTLFAAVARPGKRRLADHKVAKRFHFSLLVALPILAGVFAHETMTMNLPMSVRVALGLLSGAYSLAFIGLALTWLESAGMAGGESGPNPAAPLPGPLPAPKDVKEPAGV